MQFQRRLDCRARFLAALTCLDRGNAPTTDVTGMFDKARAACLDGLGQDVDKSIRLDRQPEDEHDFRGRWRRQGFAVFVDLFAMIRAGGATRRLRYGIVKMLLGMLSNKIGDQPAK